jgi:predicted Rossmann fold flavoprotein
VLQISTFWMPGQPLEIDLAPGSGDDELLRWLTQRREQSRQLLGTALGERLPRRVVALWLAQLASQQARLRPEARLAELGNRDLQTIADSLRRWPVTPTGSEGYRKAEAMAGGVATAELDPRTMQSRRQPGLYLVGEVVDVTGWLGGYNFQWAWSSGHAAAQAIASQVAARKT